MRGGGELVKEMVDEAGWRSRGVNREQKHQGGS